jgi:predicted DNA-binding transcriptional regulator YafY
MARPTARVMALLELLQSGGIRTVAELAGRLDVDERTVRRYVGHLIDLDVPVESVRGRYGGYRLGPGYRLPPLMLTDDEALAVLFGLAAGRRAGLLAGTDTASETAAAKIRRVLPERLARRLDALLGSLAFTASPADPPAGAAAADSAVLLSIADAVRHHRPVSIRYTGGDGRRSERILHPYGLVVHSGRWYVTGTDPGIGEDRTFRLDRIADARTLTGSFEPPAGVDPAQRVLSGLAKAPYRHSVSLRIQGTAEQIRARLPASVATLEELPLPSGTQARARPWFRAELRVEQLDWLPPVLASLDRPFVIEQPNELRGLVIALAGRLTASARTSPPHAGSSGIMESMRPEPDDKPVLPARSEEEAGIGWGEVPEPDDDERLLRDRPPHWEE